MSRDSGSGKRTFLPTVVTALSRVEMTGCLFIEQAVKPSSTCLLVLPKIVLFDKNSLFIQFFIDNYLIIAILVLPEIRTA